MAILTYQPFKGVYALSAIGFELARLPLWLVKYFLKFGRQHPEWSFRQALSVRILFSTVYHFATVQVKTSLLLTPGKEKGRFVVIKAAPSSFYKGPLAPNEDIKPVDIGATWYPAPLTSSSDTSAVTMVLHLHGGAYVVGDGRTGNSGYFAKKMLQSGSATHIFMPQYRLSTLPASKKSNPFPAALQDCLTSYLYLVNELKISPSNIVISGDSAGANAAISILRYIAEYGAETSIPAPSAAWLWSPWISPLEATSDDFTRNNPNYNTDYLSYPFTLWGSLAYAGPAGKSILSSPYISHKKNPFKTEVPLWVTTGGAEVLYFDDKEFADMMKEAGNNVTFDVEPIVPHDVLLIGGNLGFDKEATANAKRAGEWLKSVRKV
ncbi:alpha/beta-hydrolase [Lindgomyces ingoldianus]|uniref:Alpha/beta-hydrolase n=1 Tax=Lindgomyces ingoldianus TaxID=673940 RepID=A0ACB6R0I0_9PLEO|nr:alpha/beta-hydrolase [Lindgomyces ingoldianus]KAF2472328.1 alpha/beta-hydrolase [Lindgomyces ingoldianus]